MKIPLYVYIAVYIAVGFIFAIIVSRVVAKDRGYPIHSFFDLKDDEQGIIACAFVLWPLMALIFAIALVLELIVIITNREDDSE